MSDKVERPFGNNSEKNTAKELRKQIIPHFYKGIDRFASPTNAIDRRVFLLAAMTTRYSGIYFLSREDAAEVADFAQWCSWEIDQAGALIDSSDQGATIINTAVRSYLRTHPKLIVVEKGIPPNSFQATRLGGIKARKQDLDDKEVEDKQEFNLHDFAHVVAAAKSNGAFAVMYQYGLNKLPQHYKNLIYSPGNRDGTGPLYSDGILWSCFSAQLYELFHNLGLSPEQISEQIGLYFFEYFKGQRSLFHPYTKQMVTIDRQPDALDIAVLVQNKRYEGKAADVEKELYVRGTPDSMWQNPERDPLFGMTHSERIRFIASNPDPLYFEEREVGRNRGMELAYEMYAQYLLSQPLPQAHRRLLEATLEFLHLEDITRGEEINLYNLVEETIQIIREQLGFSSGQPNTL